MLGINAPPVTIKSIENAIVDEGWEQGWIVPEPPTITHRQESGGDRLRSRRPHGRGSAEPRRPHVTVLERDDRPGGLLMYGIPNMKLDKQEVVMRRIDLMEKEGIKFICNANVGENVEPMLLPKDFDAIVICTGATQARDLAVGKPQLEGRALRNGIPDRKHEGVVSTAARTSVPSMRRSDTSS